jgi:type 1 glutamine amidotransferase
VNESWVKLNIYTTAYYSDFTVFYWQVFCSAYRMRLFACYTFFALVLISIASCKEKDPVVIVDPPPFTEVAVLTETQGFRHESIDAGVAMFNNNGVKWKCVFSEMKTSAEFVAPGAATRYQILVLLNTTGDVFNEDEQKVLQEFVRGGGKVLAIHAASDAEYDWPWYNDMIGAWFSDHPATQQASCKVNQPNHIAAQGLPATWVRTDEWYNFKKLKQGLDVVISIDESTYTGGTHGANHPISWCQRFDGGKVFYTGMGHTVESYSDSLYVQHIGGAISWLKQD